MRLSLLFKGKLMLLLVGFFFFFGIVSANVNNQLCSVSVKDKPEPRDVLETHSFWNLQVKLQWVST